MQGQLLSQFQKHFYNKFSRITPQKTGQNSPRDIRSLSASTIEIQIII